LLNSTDATFQARNLCGQGVLRPTTRQMLEDAERRVAALEQATRETKIRCVPAVSVETTVKRYLENLRATLTGNVDEARRMLSLAIEKIVLRRDGPRLVAKLTGNLAGMFVLEPNLCASGGAGSPVRLFPTSNPLPQITIAVV